MPKAGTYSWFTANVLRHTELMEKMFGKLSSACYDLLPGFGRALGVDGKAVPSFAVKKGGTAMRTGGTTAITII